MSQMMRVPAELFRKFFRASRAINELHDALEDFLIAKNPALLSKLRRARREDRAGKIRPFQEFHRKIRRPKNPR